MLLKPSKTSVTHTPKPMCMRPGRKGIYLLTFSPHWLRVEQETNPTLIGCTCAQPRYYRTRESPQVGTVKMKSLAYPGLTSVQANVNGLIEYYGVSTTPAMAGNEQFFLSFLEYGIFSNWSSQTRLFTNTGITKSESLPMEQTRDPE